MQKRQNNCETKNSKALRVVMQIQPKTVQGKTRMEKLEVDKATFNVHDFV